MTLAPWLQVPDYLGAIRSGAGLGLQARAQDIQEQQHADQLGLSRDELQARREQHAAMLAESLRQHNAMEMYRQQTLAHRQQTLAQQRAHQGTTEEQARQSLIQQILNRGEQQSNFETQQDLRERAEKRLQEQAKAAAEFEPGEPMPIKLPTGEVAGYRLRRSPHVWEQLRQPNNPSKELTPNAEINALLRIASTGSALTKADANSPFFGTSTNALEQAVQSLKDMRTKKTGPKKGHIEDGYRLIGDDPADPNSWEEVE